MTSLRNRIAVLLMLAIVTVVGLASFAASQAFGPPPFEQHNAVIARQLLVLAALVEQDEPAARAAGVIVEAAPGAGERDRFMTEKLSQAFERQKSALTVLVTADADAPQMTASVQLTSGRWLQASIPDQRPPADGWKTLAIWIVLIVCGSTVVSIFAATKIIKPLQLLEGTVAHVGADGLLPDIPEVGPAEVRATAQALNRLSSRLKSAMESRMRLVAAAGHDLRTPMTRMRLRSEFIENDEERAKWLSDLEELDAIADSAMRLVREEVSSDHLIAVRLDMLVEEIVAELQQCGMDVDVAAVRPVSSRAAPLAMKRALRNLIINAATHGRRAEVRVERKGHILRITILDQGPGIPAELLGQVFEPFFRVDASRRKTVPGAGLGLAIAKEILERFGGSIEIRNREAGGLAQVITLPAVRT